MDMNALKLDLIEFSVHPEIDKLDSVNSRCSIKYGQSQMLQTLESYQAEELDKFRHKLYKSHETRHSRHRTIDYSEDSIHKLNENDSRRYYEYRKLKKETMEV